MALVPGPSRSGCTVHALMGLSDGRTRCAVIPGGNRHVGLVAAQEQAITRGIGAFVVRRKIPLVSSAPAIDYCEASVAFSRRSYYRRDHSTVCQLHNKRQLGAWLFDRKSTR